MRANMISSLEEKRKVLRTQKQLRSDLENMIDGEASDEFTDELLENVERRLYYPTRVG